MAKVAAVRVVRPSLNHVPLQLERGPNSFGAARVAFSRSIVEARNPREHISTPTLEAGRSCLVIAASFSSPCVGGRVAFAGLVAVVVAAVALYSHFPVPHLSLKFFLFLFSGTTAVRRGNDICVGLLGGRQIESSGGVGEGESVFCQTTIF